MKKILYNPIYILQLFCLVAVLMLSACKKEEENPPVITEIRNYKASPSDTLVQILEAGQWVVLLGKNLGGVSQVYFGGIPATINNTLLMDGSIVVQVPWIPFQSVPKDKLNVITAMNSSGMATFEINITGAPLITHVRNYDAAPNDTLVDAIFPGQQINIIGFNLRNATQIAFQGLNIDLTGVVYTDSSVIAKVPADLSGSDASQSNKITYTTGIGEGTYSILIYDPALLKYYSNPLYTMLTGGIGKAKTWVIDADPATGKSKKFKGPIWWCGLDLGWEKQCGPGGSCWSYEDTWQSWMPPIKDYGTMTFKLEGSPINPMMTVNQKGLDKASDNGVFSGGYFMDIDAKTITFANPHPLRMTSEFVWTKAYIISLTEDGMQLGFKDPVKAEYGVLNFVKK